MIWLVDKDGRVVVQIKNSDVYNHMCNPAFTKFSFIQRIYRNTYHSQIGKDMIEKGRYGQNKRNMPYCCVTVSMWGSEGGWGVSQSVSPDGDGECSDRGRRSQSFMAYLRGVAVTLYLLACLENLGELITKFEPFDSHKHLVA